MTAPPPVRRAAESALGEPGRLAALHATGLLGAPPVEGLERVARIAARALGAPLAQVNLITADQQVPVAVCVLPGATPVAPDGTPVDPDWTTPVGLDASFCQHVVGTGTPLAVPDARVDPRWRGNRATTDAGLVAYASVPVRVGPPGGGDAAYVLGTVCVVDFVPRQWTPDDLAILHDLAHEAAAEVARQAGEHRVRAVFDEAPAMLFTVGADGTVLEVNRFGAEALGYAVAELVGRPVAEVFHPDDRAAAARQVAAVLAAGGEPRTWELRKVRRDGPGRAGAVFWVRETGRAVRMPDGQPAAMIVCEDVTAEKEAAAERDRMAAARERARRDAEAARAEAERQRAEALAANEAKSLFLANMSHELRTPLNAIQGYAHLIEMGLYGPVTDEQRQALDRVARAQQHLLALINDVLNFSKLEAGRVEYDVRPTRVADVLGDVVPMIERQVAAKGHALEVSLPASTAGGAPLAVLADRDKLAQVLLNLLTNAVKFTPAGGRIRVALAERAEGLPAEPGVAYLSVSDTGIGIPRERQEAIFDPFVQVREGLTRPYEGTGLGLAISRDLARGMGGDLRVRSEPGAGAAFTVTLRRAA